MQEDQPQSEQVADLVGPYRSSFGRTIHPTLAETTPIPPPITDVKRTAQTDRPGILRWILCTLAALLGGMRYSAGNTLPKRGYCYRSPTTTEATPAANTNWRRLLPEITVIEFVSIGIGLILILAAQKYAAGGVVIAVGLLMDVDMLR